MARQREMPPGQLLFNAAVVPAALWRAWGHRSLPAGCAASAHIAGRRAHEPSLVGRRRVAGMCPLLAARLAPILSLSGGRPLNGRASRAGSNPGLHLSPPGPEPPTLPRCPAKTQPASASNAVWVCGSQRMSEARSPVFNVDKIGPSRWDFWARICRCRVAEG